jgi:thymidylate kinase
LEEEGFNYCHWKSNEGLASHPSQGIDLDLLVSRRDAQRFTELLHRLDFKEARPAPRREVPGVRDYYGLDAESGEVVHVHAHFQLVVGDDMTKNYRVPIEEPYLASSLRGSLLRLPSTEFEFVLFVIRMVLKHATWDATLTLMGKLSQTERRELAYLARRVDRRQVQAILGEHLPFVDRQLFDRSVELLEQGGSVWVRVKVAQRLQRCLAAHARRGYVVDTSLKLWRRTSDRVRRHALNHFSGKRLCAGGALIAIVGGDGAGKSSTVTALHGWLSKNFMTREVHLGKPPPSLARTIAKGALAVGRGFGAPSRAKAMVTEQPEGILTYAWLIRDVALARDRYRAYVRARRLSSNGDIVICDRYPLPQIKLMDGPTTASASNPNGVRRYLVDLERWYYEQIRSPDILVVLKVDPEIAVQRKADEDAGAVRIRCAEVAGLDWENTGALLVDADRPEKEVISEIKSLVWSRL